MCFFGPFWAFSCYYFCVLIVYNAKKNMCGVVLLYCSVLRSGVVLCCGVVMCCGVLCCDVVQCCVVLRCAVLCRVVVCCVVWTCQCKKMNPFCIKLKYISINQWDVKLRSTSRNKFIIHYLGKVILRNINHRYN